MPFTPATGPRLLLRDPAAAPALLAAAETLVRQNNISSVHATFITPEQQPLFEAKGWLMRVASNAVIDGSRKPRAAALADAPEPQDPQARPDAPLDRAQAARLVDAMIAALPERQRLALSLVYFEGLSNIEAAAVMEVSIEAVESLLARARRSLKESLSAEWRDLIGGLAETGH